MQKAYRWSVFSNPSFLRVFLWVAFPAILTAQDLRMGVLYMCPAERSFRVLSCAGPGGNQCQVQSYANGRAIGRETLTRQQLNALMTVCRLQGQSSALPGGARSYNPAFPAQTPAMGGSVLNALESIPWSSILWALFGLWILKKIVRGILNARFIWVPRNNREALEVFGNGDTAAREHAILEAFDSPDFTFRFHGVNKAAKMRFVLMRNIKSFRRGDLEALRFAYLAYNRGLLDDEKFHMYRITSIYGDGATDPSEWQFGGLFARLRKTHGQINQSRAAVASFVEGNGSKEIETLALAHIQKLMADRPNEDLWRDLQRRFVEGAHWMTKGELKRSAFAPVQHPYFVTLGLLEGTDTELTYGGEGSIMTIAPPRSGKTQCNVFPNLLRWPGPAVVLDVKGEIYDGTSLWRSQNVGPVIKFSPLDPAHSACYNPLTAIRRDSFNIWEDSRFLADMMIVPGDVKGDNVFWENRAREVLTAIIADLAFWNPPEQRPMSKVLSIVNRNGWAEFVDRLKKNPEVGAMRDEGASLASAEQKTLDGILQTAKSSLGAWVGERITQVTQCSDWTPLDLRNGNPTLYVCVKPNEIDAYASLLRVVIAQHIRALTSELPPRGSAPILFMLDELPRLKNMPPVEEAIEIGSQYGIRLWMFAQSLGQMQKAYANADGMIGSCAVRSFMNPSLQDGTAKFIADQVGEHSGEQHGGKGGLAGQIVTPQQLAGPEFRELQVILGVGSKPAKVRKMYAYQNPAIMAKMGALPYRAKAQA